MADWFQKIRSLVDRGKAAGQLIASRLQRFRLTAISLPRAYQALGKSVFEKQGEQSGPVEFVQPVTTARTQLAVLDAEIARLSASRPGEVFTPPRIAVAGIAAMLLVFGILVCIFGRLVLAPAHGLSASGVTATHNVSVSRPYAAIANEIQSLFFNEIAPMLRSLKVSKIEDAQEGELIAVVAKMQIKADALLGQLPLPVINISPLAQHRISDVHVRNITVKLVGFKYYVHFTFVNQSPLPLMGVDSGWRLYNDRNVDNDLWLRAYDDTGAVVHESRIEVDADVGRGERASAQGDVGKLEEVHHLEIVDGDDTGARKMQNLLDKEMGRGTATTTPANGPVFRK